MAEVYHALGLNMHKPWVHRSFDDLEQAYYLLDTAMDLLKGKKAGGD